MPRPGLEAAALAFAERARATAGADVSETSSGPSSNPATDAADADGSDDEEELSGIIEVSTAGQILFLLFLN